MTLGQVEWRGDEHDAPVFSHWKIILGNLIVLGCVGIEIILSVEFGERSDRTIESHACLGGDFNDLYDDKLARHSQKASFLDPIWLLTFSFKTGRVPGCPMHIGQMLEFGERDALVEQEQKAFVFEES